MSDVIEWRGVKLERRVNLEFPRYVNSGRLHAASASSEPGGMVALVRCHHALEALRGE